LSFCSIKTEPPISLKNQKKKFVEDDSSFLKIFDSINNQEGQKRKDKIEEENKRFNEKQNLEILNNKFQSVFP